MLSKKGNSYEFRRKGQLTLRYIELLMTLSLSAGPQRHLKCLAFVMWYLLGAAVKIVRINLDQLRIKRQIDSQLCDSICAAYVQAC